MQIFSKKGLYEVFKMKKKYDCTFNQFHKELREQNPEQLKRREVVNHHYDKINGENSLSYEEKECILFHEYISKIDGKDWEDIAWKLSSHKSRKEKQKDKRKKQRERFVITGTKDQRVIDFYETIKWKELSKKVKKIYGRRCMKCKTEKGNMHTDHILPRSLYPSLEYDIHNLQILCEYCNLEKGNKEQIDYRTQEQRDLLSRRHN